MPNSPRWKKLIFAEDGAGRDQSSTAGDSNVSAHCVTSEPVGVPSFVCLGVPHLISFAFYHVFDVVFFCGVFFRTEDTPTVVAR